MLDFKFIEKLGSDRFGESYLSLGYQGEIYFSLDYYRFSLDFLKLSFRFNSSKNSSFSRTAKLSYLAILTY